MPGLPQPLFDAVVAQILPYVQDEGDRRTWLTAQLNQDPVFHRVNWGGPARPFAVHLVHTLSHDQLATRFAACLRAESRAPISSRCVIR